MLRPAPKEVAADSPARIGHGNGKGRRRLMTSLLVAVSILVAVVSAAYPAVAGPIIILRPGFYTPTYTWSQGQAPIRMQSTSSYVCTLTRIGGDFEGGGEALHVYQAGGYWYLGGQSQHDGVQGQARCYYQPAFTSVYGTSHWLSADQGLTVTVADSCNYGEAPQWWGDAATILTGFRGNFAGDGEAVGITQSQNGFQSSTLDVNTCQGAQAWSYSYFVGRPHAGNLATYLPTSFNSFFKNPGTAATVPESTSSAADGDGITRVMARADWAMCYLTEVGGKFRSGNDYAEIIPDVIDDDGGTPQVYWALHTHSGTSDGITARARCYARNQ